MVEYIQNSCPSCQRTLRVRKQYAGHEVACSHCGHGFVVQQPDDSRGAATHSGSPSSQVISEADRESHERKIAARADELEKVRAERDRLADQLEQVRQESTSLRQERDRLAREVQQAHDRNNELADEIRSLESKLVQPAAPVASPADQQPTEELRSQLRKLQIQNEELRSVIHGLGITVG